MITPTTENTKILKAIARIEFIATDIPFHKVRESVSNDGVHWGKESLLAIPSQPGKARMEIVLESKSTASLTLARSKLEEFAKVESFTIEPDRVPDGFALKRRTPFRIHR